MKTLFEMTVEELYNLVLNNSATLNNGDSAFFHGERVDLLKEFTLTIKKCEIQLDIPIKPQIKWMSEEEKKLAFNDLKDYVKNASFAGGHNLMYKVPEDELKKELETLKNRKDTDSGGHTLTYSPPEMDLQKILNDLKDYATNSSFGKSNTKE